VGQSLKLLGFKNLRQYPECRYVFDMIESGEPLPDWIITTVQSDQSVNAFHLLDSFIRYPELQGIRVSLMLEASEVEYLRNSFELGLLSYHRRTGSIDNWKQ